jgi:hypothetical protein
MIIKIILKSALLSRLSGCGTENHEVDFESSTSANSITPACLCGQNDRRQYCITDYLIFQELMQIFLL